MARLRSAVGAALGPSPLSPRPPLSFRFWALGHQSKRSGTAPRDPPEPGGEPCTPVFRGERTPAALLLAWGWSRAFGAHEVGLRRPLRSARNAHRTGRVSAARELASRRAWAIAAAFVGHESLPDLGTRRGPRLRPLRSRVRVRALSIRSGAFGTPPRVRLLCGPWPPSCRCARIYFAVFLIIPEGLSAAALNQASATAPIGAIAGTAIAGLALVPLAAAQAAGGARSTTSPTTRFRRAPGRRCWTSPPASTRRRSREALPSMPCRSLRRWVP